MTRRTCDGPTLLRAAAAAAANLERHVQEVDALNVFPVPDGDTGSNMLATMRAALAEADALPPGARDLATVARALSAGALEGARGNSGVILSQIIRGMTIGLDGRPRADGSHLSAALRDGTASAYDAVASPVEGTILTVIRDAAEAAGAAAGKRRHVGLVLEASVAAAERSVAGTPSLLPVLRDAGVVDAGGQGLFRLLEGMLMGDGVSAEAMTAPVTGAAGTDRGRPQDRRGHGGHAGDRGDGHPGARVHGYEVMYRLLPTHDGVDIDGLRQALGEIADSVVVAGDEHGVRVHAHGARPDLVLGLGLAKGRIAQVVVEDLDRQVEVHGKRASSVATTAAPSAPDGGAAGGRASGSALVVVADGDGLASLFASMGAVVVRPSHGRRPSSGEIAAAAAATGAEDVLVLPNDRDGLLAARQAVSLSGDHRIHLIPTLDAAQGVAAALAWDPGLEVEAACVRLREAADAIGSFHVVPAARRSVVDGRTVERGAIMAIDPWGRLLADGRDISDVTLTALDRVMAAPSLVTIYLGWGFDRASADGIASAIGLSHPAVEIDVVVGGQTGEALLVAVE